MSYISQVTESILLESIQYKYKVPYDVKKQMMDFYIWSMAYQNINTADFYVLSTSSAYDLDNIIRYAIEKIVNKQKEILLEAGLISIMSELKYPVLNYWGNKKFEKIIKSYIKNFDQIYDLIYDREIGNYPQDKFVEIAKQIFDLGFNQPSYGGKPWSKICSQWLKLYNTNSTKETIQQIDKMYDLQHNTGFALNKDRRFGDWTKPYLDLKFKGNIWDLQKKSSIPKRIVGFLSKVYKQGSLEQHNLNLDKIEKQKILNDRLNTSFKIGNLDNIKKLIEQGADINAVYYKILEFATKRGYLDIVKYLIENGFDIHEYDDVALFTASWRGFLDIVKYLVENGANIHANDERALIAAINYGHIDIVKYLVENGADIHIENNRPLKYAIYYNKLDVIKYLVEKGVNISEKDVMNAKTKEIKDYLISQINK